MATLSSIITPTNVETASSTSTLTNKTIDGDNNTITNIDLAGDVKGTLPVANGGTGATSLTANNVLLGNGTSAVQVVAPGASGNALVSNGTTWTSAPISAVDYSTFQTVSSSTELTGGGVFTTVTGSTQAVTIMLSDATALDVCTRNAVENQNPYLVRVVDQDTNLIGLVAKGATAVFELKDNSTAAGVWSKTGTTRYGVTQFWNRGAQTTFTNIAAAYSIVSNDLSEQLGNEVSLRVGEVDVIYYRNTSNNYPYVKLFNRKTGALSSSETSLVNQNLNTAYGNLIAVDDTTFLFAGGYGTIVYLRKYTINPSTMTITAGTAYTETPGGTIQDVKAYKTHESGKFLVTWTANASVTRVVDTSTNPVTVGTTISTIGRIKAALPLTTTTLVLYNTNAAVVSISGTTGTPGTPVGGTAGTNKIIYTDTEIVTFDESGLTMYASVFRASGTVASVSNVNLGAGAGSIGFAAQLPGTNKILVGWAQSSTSSFFVGGLSITGGVGTALTPYTLSTSYAGSVIPNIYYLGGTEAAVTYQLSGSTYAMKIVSAATSTVSFVSYPFTPSYASSLPQVNPFVEKYWSGSSYPVGLYGQTPGMIYSEDGPIALNLGANTKYPTFTGSLVSWERADGLNSLTAAGNWTDVFNGSCKGQRIYYNSGTSEYRIGIVEAA